MIFKTVSLFANKRVQKQGESVLLSVTLQKMTEEMFLFG